MKLLIVNADDFGLNRVATDAIVECHRAGSVTSTTLMANTPDCERAAGLAAGLPGLGVGLHFNLTWGEPLAGAASVPSLVDGQGRFFTRGVLARRLLLGQVAAAHVSDELQAQWGRLRELGLRPSHVDSHQHVHGFGVVFSAVAETCRSEGIPMRVPWVASAGRGGIGRRMRRYALAGMLHRAARGWEGRVRWNDSISSIFDLPAMPSGSLSDDDYRPLLEGVAGTAHELMVHAATDAGAMAGYTRIGDAALAEYRYLREGGLRPLAEGLGFTLGSYRDLP